MPKLITRSDRTPEQDDYLYLSNAEGNADGKHPVSGFTEIPETTRTITLSASETRDEIQAKINAVSKYIPISVIITFQFLNGTYDLDNNLIFNGFYGGGAIHIYGNTSETNAEDLHTTQDVVLDCTGSGTDGLSIGFNLCTVHVYNLRVLADGGVDGIYFVSCPLDCRVFYCSVALSDTSSNGYNIRAAFGTRVYIRETYVTSGQFGIGSDINSNVFSNINDDTGTQPLYGLRAVNASIIGKGSTQPSGSTGNEQVVNGGEIR